MITLPRLLFLLFSLALAAVALAGQQHSAPPAQQPGASPAQPPAGEPPASRGSEHAPQEAEHHPKSGLLEGVFKWTNFLALFGLLGYLLRHPMREFFLGRTRAILQSLEEGRRAREEAAERLKEIESRLARLEWEIAELRRAAAGEADTERDRLRRAARAETERIFALAEQESRALARAARGELKSYAAGLAVELAEQRIRARLTPERQAALVREYAMNLGDKRA